MTHATVTPPTSAANPLRRMADTTPTVLWNDSADPDELAASIGLGAVGATCNPVIALAALRSGAPRWRSRIAELARSQPTAAESELGWSAVEELSIAAAEQLEPIFHAHRGRNGRLSIQTDPRLWRDADALVSQAVYFSALAPNMIVKIPATATGLQAIEEATYRGVSINATVSFTLSQAMAVGAAVERALRRREAEGKDVDSMGPVCTLMVGRLDDWLKVTADRDGVLTDPGYFEWAGVAVFKKAYLAYRERGYRTRLLSAAFRNHMHWSELVGGDVVISPPFGWQRRIAGSGIEPQARMDEPVDPRIIAALQSRVPEFSRAYEEEALPVSEFDTYGATRRTLRQFLAATAELDAFVRDVLLPNPDQ